MTALLGFAPLQRFRLWKPGPLGFASPDTVRLQGFAPSWRFTSSEAFRQSFMPVTLMGFSLQGLFPSRSLSSLSDARAFLALAKPNLYEQEAETSCTPDEPASPSRLCSPREFATCRMGLTNPEGRCPLGFLPSRDFLSDAAQRLHARSPPELNRSLRPKTRSEAYSSGS